MLHDFGVEYEISFELMQTKGPSQMSSVMSCLASRWPYQVSNTMLRCRVPEMVSPKTCTLCRKDPFCVLLHKPPPEIE